MRLNSAIGMKRNLSTKYFYYINNAKWWLNCNKNSRNGNINCCRAALVVPLCKSIDLFLFRLLSSSKQERRRKKTCTNRPNEISIIKITQYCSNFNSLAAQRSKHFNKYLLLKRHGIKSGARVQ